jgi:hypothetical protein
MFAETLRYGNSYILSVFLLQAFQDGRDHNFYLAHGVYLIEIFSVLENFRQNILLFHQPEEDHFFFCTVFLFTRRLFGKRLSYCKYNVMIEGDPVYELGQVSHIQLHGLSTFF